MNTETERVVLRVPVDFTAEELAGYCRMKVDSPAFEALEEALPLLKEYGEPRAILRWANVERVEDDLTTIEGVTFRSKVVADKLRDTPRVFLSVITAGEGLEKNEELADDPFLDMFNGGLLYHATAYVIRYLKDTFGYDGSSMLNPGSLPDWPIENNFPLFDMIGHTEEIGISLNEAGYIKPWNSGSHIHFSGQGYQNCQLCRKYDCIGRRAAFNKAEYIRIFGTEP